MGKGDFKHNKFKKNNNEKADKYCTHKKEQARNTEVLCLEIGKLPEKYFRVMIVKMIKNLENKMEKMKE